MIVRLVPIEQTIRKVVSDFNLGTIDIPWEEMIDWVAYGLNHISAYTQYEPKVKTLEIEDYKAKLPLDFYRIDSARFHLPHRISMDTIYVGCKTGSIELPYLAMPVDDRGFPLVPENTEYQNALYWLITSKMILRGDIKHPEISFQYADDRWSMSALSARADANLGDLQSMQGRVNDMYKLKYPRNPMRDLFNNMGKEDNLRRSN